MSNLTEIYAKIRKFARNDQKFTYLDLNIRVTNCVLLINP